MKTERYRVLAVALSLSLLACAFSVQAGLVPLSEDPAYATYYNGARKVNYINGVTPISAPMIECYGMGGGSADVGAYWTLPASHVPGESWTLSSSIFNTSSAPMPYESYAVLQMIFKTAQGDLIPFEHRLTESQAGSDRWTATSFTAVEPAGATEVSFYVKLLRDNVGNNGGIYFDNISVLSPVPEPWVTGLVALAVIAAGTSFERYRRRK